jgi:hypothetical protein
MIREVIMQKSISRFKQFYVTEFSELRRVVFKLMKNYSGSSALKNFFELSYMPKQMKFCDLLNFMCLGISAPFSPENRSKKQIRELQIALTKAKLAMP